MFIVKGSTITDQVEHWICEATVKVMDNRTTSTVEEFKLFFELYSDYDETEAYIVKACKVILRNLGYTFCGLSNWQLGKLDYDAAKMYRKLRSE